MNPFCALVHLIATRVGEAIDAGCELFDLDSDE